MVAVKALACELPYEYEVPLSRWSLPEIPRQVIERGLVASMQRKALTPNDFRSLSDLEQRLLRFQEHYAQVAKPFQWRFTRRDLRRLMPKLNTARSGLAEAA